MVWPRHHRPVHHIRWDPTAGTDYTATSGKLTFPSGQQSRTVLVPVLTDPLDESAETITLTLSEPSRWSVIIDGTATGTIENGESSSETPNENPAPTPTPTPTPAPTPEPETSLTASLILQSRLPLVG